MDNRTSERGKRRVGAVALWFVAGLSACSSGEPSKRGDAVGDVVGAEGGAGGAPDTAAGRGSAGEPPLGGGGAAGAAGSMSPDPRPAGGAPSEAGAGSDSEAAGASGANGSAGSGGDRAAGTGGEGDPPAGDCAGSQDLELGLVGWATEAGGTTGGQGGRTVSVSDGAALMQALKDQQDSNEPLTILVSGQITEANAGVNKIDVKDVRDVSILGTGDGAEFDGIGIKIVRAGNIVIRNLRIHHVAIGDKDAISIEGPADHIWIDHCELYNEFQGAGKDDYDGLLDAKAEAEYITYSWNYLHDSWKTGLVGSSEGDTFDRKLTMHHNYFRNCNSRVPLFRGGTGHVFNNYYVDIADTGINARIGACLRIENNVFENARNPWVSAFSDELGGGELICNVLDSDSTFEYGSDVHELPACSASVPYDYAAVLNHPDAVPEIVMEHAGVGKLADPTAF